MPYLIDSDWAMSHLNGIERISRQLAALQPEGLSISIVTLGELYEGVYGSRDPAASESSLELFLREVAIIPLDPEICRIFARERYRLRRTGNRIDNMDLFIGATALRHGLTLLTNNRRHFRRLAGLEMLSA